jgi:ketosteroid isomerase-like protein
MKTALAISAVLAILSCQHSLAGTEDDIKATFDRFVGAQNAHDIPAVREVLWDSPNFLWITRGSPIWGRDAALNRFETLYQGTWKLSADTSKLKVVVLNETSAQLFVPIMFNIGSPGQPAPEVPFLMNQTLVKTAAGWRVASILPIPLPPSNSALSPPTPAK